MTDIAIENGPFTDDVPIQTSIYSGFSIAMLNIQMVHLIPNGNLQKDQKVVQKRMLV